MQETASVSSVYMYTNYKLQTPLRLVNLVARTIKIPTCDWRSRRERKKKHSNERKKNALVYEVSNIANGVQQICIN